MSGNSFTTNQFEEVVEFDSHIEFTEGLLGRYDLDDEAMTRLRGEIDNLRRKHDDKLLNLSVIGEFSTGKSTFINALLRRDGFLQSSSLQGTTTTATIIESSDRYVLTCTYNNGAPEEYEFPDCASLEERLAEISSDSMKAAKLNHVSIKLPAPLLEKRGFRIIDTPGTNSSEHWHDDVTVRTISELSDLSIIIIDATKALPQQFCEFISANLQSILHQCVFVVTKVNMIRRKELEGVMQYIKEKAQKEFEIKDPLIFPYSSTDVLDNIDDLESAELPELVAESMSSERQIMDHMSSQKSIVQTLNLIALADNIFDAIQSHIQSVKDKHERALALARRKENLGSEFLNFQNEQQYIIGQEINEFNRTWGDWFDKTIDNGLLELSNCVRSRVSQFENAELLMDFFKTDLITMINQYIRKMLVDINRMDTALSDKSREICNKFVENFRERFKDVDIFEEGQELKSLYKPTKDFICLPMLKSIFLYAYQYTGLKELPGNLVPKSTRSDAVFKGRDNIIVVLGMFIQGTAIEMKNECHLFLAHEKEYIMDCNRKFINTFRSGVSAENMSEESERIENQIRALQDDSAQLNIRKGKLDMVSKMLTIMSRKELN